MKKINYDQGSEIDEIIYKEESSKWWSKLGTFVFICIAVLLMTVALFFFNNMKKKEVLAQGSSVLINKIEKKIKQNNYVYLFLDVPEEEGLDVHEGAILGSKDPDIDYDSYQILKQYLAGDIQQLPSNLNLGSLKDIIEVNSSNQETINIDSQDEVSVQKYLNIVNHKIENLRSKRKTESNIIIKIQLKEDITDLRDKRRRFIKTKSEFNSFDAKNLSEPVITEQQVDGIRVWEENNLIKAPFEGSIMLTVEGFELIPKDTSSRIVDVKCVKDCEQFKLNVFYNIINKLTHKELGKAKYIDSEKSKLFIIFKDVKFVEELNYLELTEL